LGIGYCLLVVRGGDGLMFIGVGFVVLILIIVVIVLLLRRG
jgi:hypothetical protein